MGHGGKRSGSGRKSIKDRGPIEDVEKATEIIDRAQPLAAETLVKSLLATKSEPRISGRDAKGQCEYEYVTVPDYQARNAAAKALLAKRIPDLARNEVTGPNGEAIEVAITDYRAPRNSTSAKAE